VYVISMGQGKLKQFFYCLSLKGIMVFHEYEKNNVDDISAADDGTHVGWCLYTKQEYANRKRTGMLHLVYGVFGSFQLVEIGQLILNIAKKCNVLVEWSGLPSASIILHL
jgi:hypothetical protein